jgi:hypothetical protein
MRKLLLTVVAVLVLVGSAANAGYDAESYADWIKRMTPDAQQAKKKLPGDPIGWMKSSDVGCSEMEGDFHCNPIDHYTDVYLRGGSCATYGTPFYDRPNGKPVGLIWGEAEIVLGEKSRDGMWTRVWSPPGNKKEDLGIMPYSLKALRGCG